MKNKNFAVTIIFVSIIIIYFILNEFRILDPINNKILDYQFQLRSENRSPDTNIVFIAIDQKSISFFDEQKVEWPWPRVFYSKIVDYLNSGGAKSIIFDIDLSSVIRNEESESDNELLRSSLNNSNNPFLISILSYDSLAMDLDLVNRIKIKNDDIHISQKEDFKSLILPSNKLISENTNLGIANLLSDNDGLIRHFQFYFNFNGDLYPSLSFSVAKLLKKKINHQFEEKNRYLINWYGKGGPQGCFKYYSFSSILLSEIKSEQNQKVILNNSIFKDKIVFVGGTAPSLLDYKATPISNLSPLPGMEIHGTCLSNILNDDYLIIISPVIQLLINSVLAISIVWLLLFKNKIVLNLINISAIVFSLLVFNYILFKNNYYFPLGGLILTTILGITISSTYAYFTEGKDKKYLKDLFSSYVNSSVIDQIISNPDQINLKGKETIATVFFSDIEGFTSISENLAPKDLVEILNKYFETMSDIILDNSGLLDKYIGDGIMAIYGAPILMENHAAYACKSALLIQEALDKFQLPDFPRVRLKTRIGLNTGKMIIGNIGTQRKMEFTAIGDSVNLSSRLEGMNKVFGTKIMVSESTKLLCEDNFIFRELDTIAVKGKLKPVKVYELLAEKSEQIGSEIILSQMFKRGLEFYKGRLWDVAEGQFLKILEDFPNDTPTKVYLDRIKKFKMQEPEVNWDGVFYAKTK